MRIHSLTAFAAVAALGVGSAYAQDRAGRFVERDKNGDGVLSQEEYTSTGGHPGNFRALDLNGDGVLSRGEFVDRTGAVEAPTAASKGAIGSSSGPWGGAVPRIPRPGDPDYRSNAGPVFENLDTNRDSVIQRSEWHADRAVFDRMDTNNDNLVTTGEWIAYENSANGGGALVKTGREFNVLDYDNDGLLTRREWNGDRVAFDRMDVNDDGMVSRREFTGYGEVGGNDGDRREFRVLDYDNDGVLSRREWNGNRAEFDRLDVNNDGVVSFREYDSPVDTTRGLRFRELDRNRDAMLSRAEWPVDRSTFDGLDRNRDGRLSTYEFSDVSRLDDRFYSLDRNRDGRLERREWLGTTDAFRWLDRNRDGRLTRDEFTS